MSARVRASEQFARLRRSSSTRRSGRSGGTELLPGADAAAAEVVGDSRAWRFGVVGREGDFDGAGACIDQDVDGAEPIGVRIRIRLLAAADEGPVQRRAVP